MIEVKLWWGIPNIELLSIFYIKLYPVTSQIHRSGLFIYKTKTIKLNFKIIEKERKTKNENEQHL